MQAYALTIPPLPQENHQDENNSFASNSMKPISLFLAFIICCIVQVKSQSLSGQVFDYQSKKTLPYTAITVKNSHLGTYSDDNGRFTIDCKTTDTLFLSLVGYEPKILAVTAIRDSIFLKMSNVLLREIVVAKTVLKPKYDMGKADKFGESKTEWLGYYRKKERKGYDLRLRETAVLIENPHRRGLRISTVRCLIAKNRDYFYYDENDEEQLKSVKNERLLVRLRIYSPDENGRPSEFDLLKESIVREVEIRETELDFDVSQYKIILPVSGFFVSLEFLGLLKNKTFIPYEKLSDEEFYQFSVRFQTNTRGNAWAKGRYSNEWGRITQGPFSFSVKAQVPQK